MFLDALEAGTYQEYERMKGATIEGLAIYNAAHAVSKTLTSEELVGLFVVEPNFLNAPVPVGGGGATVEELLRGAVQRHLQRQLERRLKNA